MKLLLMLLLISFSFMLTSCGGNSSNQPQYAHQGPNYNYNNYRASKKDYHSYRGNRYNYNWNNHSGSYLNKRGPAGQYYCGNKYRDTNGLCYVSCMERAWSTVSGYQSGYVWTCNYYTCAWVPASTNRTWYTYQLVPTYRTVSCY